MHFLIAGFVCTGCAWGGLGSIETISDAAWGSVTSQIPSMHYAYLPNVDALNRSFGGVSMRLPVSALLMDCISRGLFYASRRLISWDCTTRLGLYLASAVLLWFSLSSRAYVSKQVQTRYVTAVLVSRINSHSSLVPSHSDRCC